KLNTSAPIDEIVALDAERRTLLTESEGLKAERNRVSKQIGGMKDAAQREPLIAAMKKVGDRISELDSRVRQVDARLHELLPEVLPPFLVREEAAYGSAHLPKFRDTMYHDDEDNLFLVPTAEMPVTNLHRDEIVIADELPLKYVAYTPCFRRERAAAGRDTRGLKRVHQFDKVEMYWFTTPETSYQALDQL